MTVKMRIAFFVFAASLAIRTSCTSESAVTRTTGTSEGTVSIKPFDSSIRPRDGMTMVYVPAGQFDMGSNVIERAQPAHPVVLDAFWIDQTEVTNAMFSAFLKAHGNQRENGVQWLEPGAGYRGIVYGQIEENDGEFRVESGYDAHPVIEVSWYGASAYCSWVGGRLPTEAEWEYAARSPHSWVYPWGNDFDGERANFCDINCKYKWKDTKFDDGFEYLAPVGSYPIGASWCGALDMAGNVWEWVSDWWSEAYSDDAASSNPHGPETGTLRIARGASWYDEGEMRPLSFRKGLSPSSYRMHWVGFRCVTPDKVNNN